MWNRAQEVYPAALSAHFRTMLTTARHKVPLLGFVAGAFFSCRIVQELNTIFQLFYWLFCFWCSSSWINTFNNILVNTSVGNTGSCDPLWKHFIISYMSVVCVPIKSYKLEEFGEITLLYNSVMYYNIVTLPMHLCFLSSWITGAGIYLESTWSFLLAFEQRFLFKDVWVVFPQKGNKFSFTLWGLDLLSFVDSLI